MTGLLVVGGSDAGVSAALRARQRRPDWPVKMVVADAYPNFSICGLPFLHSGEVSNWRDLAHRTTDELERAGIELLVDTRATRIEATAHEVDVEDATGRRREPYEKLVVATGATARQADIPGIDRPGVHTLHTMGSAFALERTLQAASGQRAVIVGMGYIGLEMADALVRRGLSVTILGRGDEPLRTVDPALGRLVREELEGHGVRVVAGAEVNEISSTGQALHVVSEGLSAPLPADVVVVATGVRPNVALLREAGAALGAGGAASVCRQMRTDLPDVFAAGDCCETWHRIVQENRYLPLGSTAHKQGRIAGDNAAGGDATFAGSLGTQIVKIFDLAIARTGLSDREAAAAGFDPLTVESVFDDHKRYYPGAHPLTLRITGDRASGRLLGAQVAGHWRAGVAGRIDTLATGIFHGMNVEATSDLDLAYTPPLGSPWDAAQLATQAWTTKRT